MVIIFCMNARFINKNTKMINALCTFFSLSLLHFVIYPLLFNFFCFSLIISSILFCRIISSIFFLLLRKQLFDNFSCFKIFYHKKEWFLTTNFYLAAKIRPEEKKKNLVCSFQTYTERTEIISSILLVNFRIQAFTPCHWLFKFISYLLFQFNLNKMLSLFTSVS